MKITPLDIHHKEFHRGLRGYSEEEVDSFLDLVADEFERLFKENAELKEQLDKDKEKLARFENLEQTLQNTLITAQKSAEDVQDSARQKSELMIKEAELKSRELLQSVNDERQRLDDNYKFLKKSEADFRSQFKELLTDYLMKIEELEARRMVEKEEEAERQKRETRSPGAAASDERETTSSTVGEPRKATAPPAAGGEVKQPSPGPVPKEQAQDERRPVDAQDEKGGPEKPVFSSGPDVPQEATPEADEEAPTKRGYDVAEGIGRRAHGFGQSPQRPGKEPPPKDKPHEEEDAEAAFSGDADDEDVKKTIPPRDIPTDQAMKAEDGL